jgi:MoxR-like ATPase
MWCQLILCLLLNPYKYPLLTSPLWGKISMSIKQEIFQLRQHINQYIIGQEALVTRLLVALLADGHLLVEGAPGLAKTRAIRTLSDGLECSFHRIQFTPDLLPADVTGTEIYHEQDASFKFQAGPIFHNLILADEINRAPAKVQSALLEAMAEHQVTIGKKTHLLPKLFLVMATQNPIEQEGTYPLPEAQRDRFLIMVKVDYPDAAAEHKILALTFKEAHEQENNSTADIKKLSQETLFAAREEVLDVHLAPQLEEYLIQLVIATRDPSAYGEDLVRWLEFGASPRATIALARCAKAYAWLQDRDYVNPEDIQTLAYDVLRHRILLSFEAEAEGVSTDQFIKELLFRVPVS